MKSEVMTTAHNFRRNGLTMSAALTLAWKVVKAKHMTATPSVTWTKKSTGKSRTATIANVLVVRPTGQVIFNELLAGGEVQVRSFYAHSYRPAA